MKRILPSCFNQKEKAGRKAVIRKLIKNALSVFGSGGK
jgi:hypothetical protein